MNRPFALTIDTNNPRKRPRETESIESYSKKIKSDGLQKYFTEAMDELTTTNTEENIKFVSNIMRVNKPLVLHRNRQFETCEFPAVKYNSSVYVDSQTKIVKIVEYNNNFPCADFDLVKEVATQKYVYDIIAPKCVFRTPRILRFGKVDLDSSSGNYNCVFFIVMEKVVDPMLKTYLATASAEERIRVNDKLTEIKKCLSDNNIYHNDIHEENVMVGTDGSITIIDWGRGSTEFDYTKLKDSVTTLKQSVKNNGGRKKTRRQRRRRRRRAYRGSNK
jgi:serine/threonine protein kinase